MMRLGLAAAFALTGSVLLHGAGLLALSGSVADPSLSGGHSAPPLLGDSFADLAEGMAQPVAATPAQMSPVPPAELAPASPIAAASVPNGLAALAPLAAASVPIVIPPDAAQTAPAPPTTRPRPAPRAETAQPLRPRPEASAKRANAPAAQGSTASARKGTATGTTTGTSARAQGQQQAQGDGGAAATARYGAAVMRKIASTRKTSTRLRGTAVIAFHIGPGGQLVSAQVARSSGQPDLDQLGLDHIRRAAPFPPPPAGAATRFSVEFQGR